MWMDRRADGQIDRHDEVNSCFYNFQNVPRNVLSSLQLIHRLQKLCSFLVQLLSEMGGDVSTSN